MDKGAESGAGDVAPGGTAAGTTRMGSDVLRRNFHRETLRGGRRRDCRPRSRLPTGYPEEVEKQLVICQSLLTITEQGLDVCASFFSFCTSLDCGFIGSPADTTRRRTVFSSGILL